jgi:transposase
VARLSRNDKIKIYKEYKKGKSIMSLTKKYKIKREKLQYLIRLINRHGYGLLKETKNKVYSRDFKQKAIDRVLNNNESINSVAIDIGLYGEGLLSNWIKKYKENGYNIVERKRGRSTMPKLIKKKSKETKDETIKRLEQENLYLKAELEYSKKLRAVVQARKNQQQKKK